MTEPRVFIVHRTTVRGPAGARVDKFDFTPAEHYGKLVHIFKDGEANQSAKNIMHMLTHMLLSFRNDDSLLCTGDPMIILMAGMVLERHCLNWTRMRILKWDKHRGEYKSYYIERSGTFVEGIKPFSAKAFREATETSE